MAEERGGDARQKLLAMAAARKAARDAATAKPKPAPAPATEPRADHPGTSAADLPETPAAAPERILLPVAAAGQPSAAVPERLPENLLPPVAAPPVALPTTTTSDEGPPATASTDQLLREIGLASGVPLIRMLNNPSIANDRQLIEAVFARADLDRATIVRITETESGKDVEIPSGTNGSVSVRITETILQVALEINMRRAGDDLARLAESGALNVLLGAQPPAGLTEPSGAAHPALPPPPPPISLTDVKGKGGEPAPVENLDVLVGKLDTKMGLPAEATNRIIKEIMTRPDGRERLIGVVFNREQGVMAFNEDKNRIHDILDEDAKARITQKAGDNIRLQDVAGLLNDHWIRERQELVERVMDAAYLFLANGPRQLARLRGLAFNRVSDEAKARQDGSVFSTPAIKAGVTAAEQKYQLGLVEHERNPNMLLAMINTKTPGYGYITETTCRAIVEKLAGMDYANARLRLLANNTSGGYSPIAAQMATGKIRELDAAEQPEARDPKPKAGNPEPGASSAPARPPSGPQVMREVKDTSVITVVGMDGIPLASGAPVPGSRPPVPGPRPAAPGTPAAGSGSVEESDFDARKTTQQRVSGVRRAIRENDIEGDEDRTHDPAMALPPGGSGLLDAEPVVALRNPRDAPAKRGSGYDVDPAVSIARDPRMQDILGDAPGNPKTSAAGVAETGPGRAGYVTALVAAPRSRDAVTAGSPVESIEDLVTGLITAVDEKLGARLLDKIYADLGMKPEEAVMAIARYKMQNRDEGSGSIDEALTAFGQHLENGRIKPRYISSICAMAVLASPKSSAASTLNESAYHVRLRNAARIVRSNRGRLESEDKDRLRTAIPERLREIRGTAGKPALVDRALPRMTMASVFGAVTAAGFAGAYAAAGADYNADYKKAMAAGGIAAAVAAGSVLASAARNRSSAAHQLEMLERCL